MDGYQVKGVTGLSFVFEEKNGQRRIFRLLIVESVIIRGLGKWDCGVGGAWPRLGNNRGPERKD